MKKEKIIKLAGAGTPFFGLYWQGIHRIENYEIRDDEGFSLLYCAGQGDFNWYHIDEYGKKWAFHLNELDDDILNPYIQKSKPQKKSPKTEELCKLYSEYLNTSGLGDYEVGYRNGLRYAEGILSGADNIAFEARNGLSMGEYRLALLEAIHENNMDELISDNPLMTEKDIARFVKVIKESE